MSRSDPKPVWLPRMAEFVLMNGLSAASLRPLAKAAGTSDRMLIYHFGSKEKLIESLLDHLTDVLTEQFAETVPPGRASCTSVCLEELSGLMRTKAMRPVLQLFCEAIAASSRRSHVHTRTASLVLRALHSWLLSRLPDEDADPLETSTALLASVAGILVLEASQHSDLADCAVHAWKAKEN